MWRRTPSAAIVGSDQLFNELMGRFYQERLGQKQQIIITTKITPGIDGKEKMSKSLGNYIALDDSPRDKFGKAMSIPDALIAQYLEVYTDVPMENVLDIANGLKSETLHPMTAKKALASAIVARHHGNIVAETEESWFEKTFSNRSIPTDVPQILAEAGMHLIGLLQRCMPQESTSSLRRLLKQGAVSINGQKVAGPSAQPHINDGDVIKIGKKNWYKIKMQA